VVDRKHGLLEHRLVDEQQTYARPLGSLLRHAPVTCQTAATLATIAALMRDQKVGSVVVVDDRAHPLGIVTSHDVVQAIANVGGDLRAGELMTPAPHSLPAHAFAYEAAVLMTERRIRHVLVVEEGRLAGVISERDLFSLQRLGLGELTMEIRLAADIARLAALAANIRTLIGVLAAQGAATVQLTLFVSVLNDRVCQRVLELARPHHALDRIGWCWLSFGSEGRLEQTVATDQDNGLVFVAHDGSSPEQARRRLLPFAREVNDGLDACGFPLCKGNVMGSNPQLCLSVEEWQAKMSGWVANTDPKALLDASICFDFRPMAGDVALAGPLRSTLLARARARPAFLRLLAANALAVRPPRGLLRDFSIEDAPGAPGTLDLKALGTRLFVDGARIYALAHGLPQTNTIERLRAAAAAGALRAEEVSAWVGAFTWLQQLRLRVQVERGAGEAAVANRIDPYALDGFERRALKEAFRQAASLQDRIRSDYQL
jgi:CBS domain-containing protein